MLDFINSLFDGNKSQVKSLQKIVDLVNEKESWAKKLKDSQFKVEISKLKKELDEGKTLDDILPEVFALVREAAVRTLDQRPFDVQLIGATALHQGKVAEQRTGEGKTLTAAHALVLNSLFNQGAHLVTVNDYLARIGTGWMGPLYNLLGVSVAVIYSGKGDQPAAIFDPEYKDVNHDDERLRHLKPCSRKEAYEADITYGTNNEFGFDYLRDNMARSKDQISQRSHHFAIVDEVDSILIDEARTPLIISAPDSDATDKYYKFAKLVKTLSKDSDYEVDEKLNSATLTDYGLKKIEKILNVENLYETDYDTLHHIEQSLKALSLFNRDKDYVIKDNEIIIVDDNTGRLMYGRRYSDGLHQAIEAKENVTVQQESRTLATISLQNYFRMYEKLSGMTGTAQTEKEEFMKIYGLPVVVIPTNRPVARIDHSDIIYKTQTAKYQAIVEEVKQCYEKGQPVLIGTKSIEQNQIIDRFLKRLKIPHQVLNAKNHEQEAAIVSEAGRLKAITVATNIAGRGVDIVLGGDPEGRTKKDWQKEHDAVKTAGGLHILGAVRHESRRIDNQFRGRSGRQGDPGSSRFYISLEDDIMRIFGGEQISRLMDILKVPDSQPLEAKMVSRAIETAQSKVESFHFDQRKRVVEYDDVVNKQREIFYGRRQKILLDEESISKNIDNILVDQATELTTVYSPDGIDKQEADRIARELQTIIPLDSSSAGVIKRQLTKKDKNEADKVLTEVILGARKNQRQILGEVLPKVESQLALSTYDELWMQHLDQLDGLREGIGLRGYAQKDPIVEYKSEAFSLFETLLSRIDYQLARKVFRVRPAMATPQAPKQNLILTQPDENANTTNMSPAGKKIEVKIGRNDPCWCGSGKKFKKCHYPELPKK
jgi:preprotein translocase subunit SecA